MLSSSFPRENDLPIKTKGCTMHGAVGFCYRNGTDNIPVSPLKRRRSKLEVKQMKKFISTLILGTCLTFSLAGISSARSSVQCDASAADDCVVAVCNCAWCRMMRLLGGL